MIRLTATTRKLQAVLASAITTNHLPVIVNYSDKTSAAYSGGCTLINTNNTTAVDICAAPAASTIRDIDNVLVRNADTVSATVTIRYNDNGTTYDLIKVTLDVGDQLEYTHAEGWTVMDALGVTKQGFSLTALGTAAYLDANSVVLTAAPTTITSSTSTVSSNATALIVNYAGTCTLTLPAASTYPGKRIFIKTITANTVVSASSNVVPADSGTAGTAILAATAGKFAQIISDGTNWVIMGSN